MRILPAKLREKIEKASQTIYENADPKMDVFLRRARTGLTGTDLFYMQTIREGTDLEALGIDLQRTNVNAPPSKAFNIYIKDGICKVATKNLPSKVKEPWVDVLTVGPATDCDIAFDGRWYRDDQYRWQLVTQGNPWLFYVTGGKLYARHWTATPILLAEGVSKIAALRGWKNTYMWNHDQGIIVAYIKSGQIYYRNYCQQPPDQPALWEIERQVDLPTPAQNVALFRTNDYRTGFLCESEGQIHWAITTRNWANMATEVHSLSAGIDISVALIDLEYSNVWLKHNLSAGIDLQAEILYLLSDNLFKSAENDGETTVIAVTRHFLTNINPADFMIYDITNATFSVTNIEYGSTKNELIMTVDSLAFSAPDDLTLKFLGGTTKGEAGQNVDPFEITFTPTGIDYVEVDPPQVEVIWNE
jgi:hypothetical protein